MRRDLQAEVDKVDSERALLRAAEDASTERSQRCEELTRKASQLVLQRNELQVHSNILFLI